MDQRTSKSCQELFDSQFYCGILVILLLHTVSSVPRSCMSIKLYRAVVNIEMGLLGKKSVLDISQTKLKKTLGRID